MVKIVQEVHVVRVEIRIGTKEVRFYSPDSSVPVKTVTLSDEVFDQVVSLLKEAVEGQ